MKGYIYLCNSSPSGCVGIWGHSSGLNECGGGSDHGGGGGGGGRLSGTGTGCQR